RVAADEQACDADGGTQHRSHNFHLERRHAGLPSLCASAPPRWFSATGIARHGERVGFAADPAGPAQRLRRILTERGAIVGRESSELAESAAPRHLLHAPRRRILQGGTDLGQCARVQMPRRRRATYGAHCSGQRALSDPERRADSRYGSRFAETCVGDLLEAIDDLLVALCRDHGDSPQFIACWQFVVIEPGGTIALRGNWHRPAYPRRCPSEPGTRRALNAPATPTSVGGGSPRPRSEDQAV